MGIFGESNKMFGGLFLAGYGSAIIMNTSSARKKK